MSAPMWNITHPESKTAASGTQTERNASPPSCKPMLGARRRSCATTRLTARLAPATATASQITGRACSRRPTRSAGGAASSGSLSIFSRSLRTWTVTVPVSWAE